MDIIARLRPRRAAARQSSFVAALRTKTGGAMGSRTPDLLIANETLYQLSYDPTQVCAEGYSIAPKMQAVFFRLFFRQPRFSAWPASGPLRA